MSDLELRRFPASSRLLLHVGAGRTGRYVSSLAGAADWRRDLTDRAGAATVALFGSRLLAPADAWAWPGCSCAELTEALRGDLPGLRILGAATPRQDGRQRLSLLGRAMGTLTVIKLGADRGDHADHAAGSLAAEATALGLLETDPLPGIATPRVLASGLLSGFSSGQAGAAVGDIEFVATTSVGMGTQRAAIDASLRTFSDDLAVRLAALPKSVDVAPDAVPVHGDLTPWNLRRTPRGLALFDWESVGWGAPGSDLDMYQRTCNDIRPPWRRQRRSAR